MLEQVLIDVEQALLPCRCRRHLQTESMTHITCQISQYASPSLHI